MNPLETTSGAAKLLSAVALAVFLGVCTVWGLVDIMATMIG